LYIAIFVVLLNGMKMTLMSFSSKASF